MYFDVISSSEWWRCFSCKVRLAPMMRHNYTNVIHKMKHIILWEMICFWSFSIEWYRQSQLPNHNILDNWCKSSIFILPHPERCLVMLFRGWECSHSIRGEILFNQCVQIFSLLFKMFSFWSPKNLEIFG